MPPSVARDFERGMAEPTAEELEALRRGMDEMPPHVDRDFAEAPMRLIPTGVRESFENPYPPISEEDLNMLRQRQSRRESSVTIQVDRETQSRRRSRNASKRHLGPNARARDGRSRVA